MASDKYHSLFKCVRCESQLNKLAKTLTCLHSLCNACFIDTLEEEETKGKCPECDVVFKNDKHLTVSPILANEFIRQQVNLSEWQCDSCLEEGNSSVAKYWCYQCERLLCTKCMRFHKKFTENHISKDLEKMERMDAIKLMMRKKCLLHGKDVELFCERCNMCYCNTCYECHATEPSSSCMDVPPLMVRDEVLKRRTQVPILEREMEEFKEIVKASSENVLKYSEELNIECESKCHEIWTKYEQIVENAKRDALDLCGKLKQETAEEVKRWHNILEKNKRILKEIEIWRLNFQHLLREDHEDREILCGLKLLTSRLPSRHHKWNRPIEKCELCFTLPDWWHEAVEPLASRQIGSVSCVKKTLPVKKLVKENQWILPGSKSRSIITILVSEKDNHIFLCDHENQSIIEISEGGEFLSEFLFCDKENQNFKPMDICSISPDIFVVCGKGEKNLIFFERIKILPFLKIQKIVQIKTDFYSLCEQNGLIFACDFDFKIHSFTKEGIEMKTIEIEGMEKAEYYPRIRVDPMSGNLWGTRWDYSEIISFNSKVEKLDSFKKEQNFFDFCFNDFGQFYCNFEGIFSFFPQKVFYNFEKKSKKEVPKMFVLQNKLFVCFENDGKWLIEVFKIFY